MEKITFVGLVFGLALSSIASADPCVGLTGNAFGLCNAATTEGNACDVDSSTKSCTRLAARYEQLTGQTPPWLAPVIVCPTALNALAYWYESGEFANVDEVNLIATFTNNGPSPMIYSNSTSPQVWSVPDVASPTVVFNYSPADQNIPPGGNFTLNLSVDVSGFDDANNKFALRPRDGMYYGTVSPQHLLLQSVSYSCN